MEVLSYLVSFTMGDQSIRAAAFIVAERRPSSLEVVTLDDRLVIAARKKGFALIAVPSVR